jgi:RNA polymerase sigma-70 factor (ECF subfamily)
VIGWPGSGRQASAPPGDDAALLARSAAGDAVAFRMLVDRHLSLVVAVARRILGDEAEAEDVAQDVMLRMWNTGDALDVAGHGLRPWLRRVTTNLAIDRFRARRRTDVTDEVPELPDAPTQERGLVEEDLSARVAAAMQALPERQRLALSLFHFEGRSQSEVAAALGVTDEAVESLLARARRALKAALKDEWRDLLPDDET